MKIGPVDTSAVKSAVKSIQDDIRSSLGGISNSGSSYRPASSSAQRSISSSMVNVGMPGYGQSVRDRAADAAKSQMTGMSAIQKLEALHGKMQAEEKAALEKMAAEGQDVGFSDAEMGKLQEKLAKKAALLIREQDREESAAQRAIERANKVADAEVAASERAQKKKEDEARKEAQSGVREWSRGKKVAERKAKKEDAETTKRIKEETSALNDQNQAAIQTAKGIAQVAASTGLMTNEMVHGVVAIEGFANIAKNASAAFGTPWAIAITGVVAGLAILRESLVFTRDSFKKMLEDAAATSAGSYSAIHKIGIAAMQSGHRMAAELPENVHRFTARQVYETANEEKGIQRRQEEYGVNWQRRHSVRERAEQNLRTEHMQEALQVRSEHLDKQSEINKKTLKKLPDLQKASELAYDGKIAAIEKRKIAIPGNGETDVPGSSRQKASGKVFGAKELLTAAFVASTGPAGMGSLLASGGAGVLEPKTDYDSTNPLHKAQGKVISAAGGISVADAEINNEKVKVDLAQALADRKKELKAEEEETIRLQQQSLQIGQAKVANTEQQVKVSKEAYDAARKAYEEEKEAHDRTQISHGLLNEGDQSILKEIDEKRKDIEAKEAENEQRKKAGRADLLPVDELSQWELQRAASAGRGTKLAEYADREGHKRGGNLGIEMVSDISVLKDDLDVKSKAYRADAANGKVGGHAAGAIDKISELQKENEETADNIVEGFKNAFKFDVLFEKFKQAFEEKQREFETFRMNQNRVL